MFYDLKVMNSRTLGPAWRLAHHVSDDTSNADLKKICSSLNKCLKSGRVSLRTSSMFVNGAARLYKEEADKLYRDCIQLNKEMIRCNNKPPIRKYTHSSYTEEDSRNCIQLNKEMIRCNNKPPIRKYTHSSYTEEDSRNCIQLNKEMIRCNNKPPIRKYTHSSYTEEDSRKIQRNSNSHCKYSNRRRNYPYPILRSPNKRSVTNGLENLTHTDETNTPQSSSSTTEEIGVQTTKSFISDRSKKNFPNPDIDKTQPFGLMMVYDTETRIPRKIVYSRINVQTL